MKKTLLVSTTMAAMFAMTAANADLLYGLYADVNYWSQGAKISLNETNIAEFDDEKNIMASVSLEHGVPVIPNARVKYTKFEAENDLEDIKNLDNSIADAILYYELLDNVVSIDTGLGMKRYTDGSSDSSNMAMVYASAGAKAPFTPFSAKVDVSIAKNKDMSVNDAQAEIKYKVIDNIAFDIGAKAGYRMLEVTKENDAIDTVTEFKGPYAGIEVHF